MTSKKYQNNRRTCGIILLNFFLFSLKFCGKTFLRVNRNFSLPRTVCIGKTLWHENTLWWTLQTPSIVLHSTHEMYSKHRLQSIIDIVVVSLDCTNQEEFSAQLPLSHRSKCRGISFSNWAELIGTTRSNHRTIDWVQWVDPNIPILIWIQWMFQLVVWHFKLFRIFSEEINLTSNFHRTHTLTRSVSFIQLATLDSKLHWQRFCIRIPFDDRMTQCRWPYKRTHTHTRIFVRIFRVLQKFALKRLRFQFSRCAIGNTSKLVAENDWFKFEQFRMDGTGE